MDIKIKVGLVIGLLIVVLIAGIWFSSDQEERVVPEGMVLFEDGEFRPYTSEPSGEVIETRYQCDGEEYFTTSYDIGSNEITLQTHEGAEYVLPQIVTEQGAQYGTFDGTVRFMEADGAASVEREEVMIYTDCIPVLDIANV